MVVSPIIPIRSPFLSILLPFPSLLLPISFLSLPSPIPYLPSLVQPGYLSLPVSLSLPIVLPSCFNGFPGYNPRKNFEFTDVRRGVLAQFGSKIKQLYNSIFA
jgi:hypothetical protein